MLECFPTRISECTYLLSLFLHDLLSKGWNAIMQTCIINCNLCPSFISRHLHPWEWCRRPWKIPWHRCTHRGWCCCDRKHTTDSVWRLSKGNLWCWTGLWLLTTVPFPGTNQEMCFVRTTGYQDWWVGCCRGNIIKKNYLRQKKTLY